MEGIEISDLHLAKKLRETKTIAVIGCSDKQYRTSYHIAKYLKKAGYDILPVNPNIQSSLGVKAYGTILEIPKNRQVDIIDIFRNKRYSAEMVEEIVKWSKKTGQKPLIWTQLDVSTDRAKEIALNAGLPYVENRCLMVEHGRLL